MSLDSMKISLNVKFNFLRKNDIEFYNSKKSKLNSPINHLLTFHLIISFFDSKKIYSINENKYLKLELKTLRIFSFRVRVTLRRWEGSFHGDSQSRMQDVATTRTTITTTTSCPLNWKDGVFGEGLIINCSSSCSNTGD